MRTKDGMNDAQRKAVWATVTDPREALEEIVEHADFLGGDPYYSDILTALIEMAERALKTDARKVEIDGDDVTLPSGRVLYANRGVVGLGPDGDLYGGYDGTLPEYDDPLSPSDMRVLALWMSARWAALAENAGAQTPASAEFLEGGRK